MKKHLLIRRFFTTLLLVAVSTLSWAYDFKVDGIYYNKNDDGTSVTVTYKTTSNRGYSGAVVIPSSVTYANKTYKVTEIGDYTFYNCSDLTSITIPNSVTSIGDLQGYVFCGCSSLTSITIPESVQEIKLGFFTTDVFPFYGCSSLTSVTLNSNTIVSSPRNSYNSLESIFGEQVEEYIIGENVTCIGDSAFFGCSNLTSVTIPNSVESIGSGAFSGCTSLPVIDNVRYADTFLVEATDKTQSAYNIKNGTRFIGNAAFKGCYSLISISIPNSVENIASRAFSSCSSLTSVTIGNSVTSIIRDAFEDCSCLASINIESENTKYDSRDNCNAIIETALNTLVTGCKSSIIPNSITSIGEYAFYKCSGLTSLTIPKNVTNISDYAFSGCSNLKSITIGESVTSIGNYAFSGCSGLTSVTLNSNDIVSKMRIDMFYIKSIGSIFGSQVKEYIIGEGVTSIGDAAFYGCSGLTSVIIPSSVTSVGYFAFQNCSGLTSIIIPSSVTSIDDYAFSGCTSLPVIDNIRYADTYLVEAVDKTKSTYSMKNGTRFIGNSAFEGCSNLTSVTIPNSVTSIGHVAFSGCSGLMSVVIPNSVDSIGSQVFYGCSSLTSISVASGNTKYDSRDNCNAIIKTSSNTLRAGCKNTIIPNSVTSIGYYAFGGCSGLTSIIIPSSVTSIGDYAFYKCSGLTSVTLNSNAMVSKEYNTTNNLSSIFGSQVKEYIIGEDVTNIGECAFYKCSNLKSITIGSGVTSIGNDTFSGCEGLTSVIIPESVTSIGDGAFYGCDGLTSISIPNSVTYIGNSAFAGCSDLKSITIGSGVESIEDGAFIGCSSLTSVTCWAENIPTIGRRTFPYYTQSSATLYVPESSLNAYKTADQWKDFATILPIDPSDVDELKASEAKKTGTNAPIYDLNGRRLTEKPKSGYYIQGGKKYTSQ